MGKKSSPPKAPNLAPLIAQQTQQANQQYAIAMEQLGISKEQLAWAKENAAAEFEFAKQQADRMFGLQDKANKRDEEMFGINKEIARRQMDAMDTQQAWATEDRQRYKDVFQPMQDRFIAEANAYDTPERREAEASRAMVDIQRQSEAQRNNADARLRSMGIDPSQVRSGSMMNQLGVVSAAQQAGAGNQARENVENTGRQLRAAAIDMGNGLPGQALAAYAGSGNNANVSLNATTAATQQQQMGIGNQIAAAQAGMGFRSNALGQYGAMTGSPTQWAGMAGNSFGQSGNMLQAAGNSLNQHFANNLTRWDARRMQQQAWFDNTMKVAETASNFFSMAEGGAVGRRRPVHRAEGGGFDFAGMAGAMKKKKPQEGMKGTQSYAEATRNKQAPEVNAVAPPKQGFMDRMRARAAEMKDSMPEGSNGGMMTGGDPIDIDTSDVYKIGTMDSTQDGSIVHRRVHVNSAKTGHKVDKYEKPQLGEPGEAKIAGRGGHFGVQPNAVDFNAFLAEGGGGGGRGGNGGGGRRVMGAIPRRQVRDTYDAKLAEGEYVIPADVVQSVGVEKLDKLVAKYHRPGA